MTALRLAWDLLRAEGPRGLLERLAERAGAFAGRLGERSASPERLAREARAVPVLDVLATPLAPRWGGVPVQLGARLVEERRLRPTALLSPEGGRWTLRVWRGSETLRVLLGPFRPESEPSHGLGASTPAVRQAVALVGARIVNVEGVAGWRPGALLGLAGEGRKLVLSLHDFALFCPRPNLVEEPGRRFCGYSRDAGRCRACLAVSWSLPAGFVEGWREDAAGLLAAADAVVFPSDFLRRQHATLFPGVRAGAERVIAPAAPEEGVGGAVPATRPVAPSGVVRVAFVGAFRSHKGALVFVELVRREKLGERPARWSILGSGDPALVREARRRGARARGHYRAGSLARRLREEKVDVALLLSVWPETYSLTLSECRAAGVPVVAFDHGAIAERIGREGGGVVVSLEDGAEGIRAALEGIVSGRLEVPSFRAGPPGATARDAAVERDLLYRSLIEGEF